MDAGERVSQDMAIAYSWDMAAIRAMQRTQAEIDALNQRLARQRVRVIFNRLVWR